MNQATHIATESTRQVVRTPRRQRVGSAIASVLVTGVLFGSVVLGMTSMGDAGDPLVAQARATTPA